MRPIEPGCTAIIMSGDSAGRQVTVIKAVDTTKDIPWEGIGSVTLNDELNPWWEIDISIMLHGDNLFLAMPYCPEKRLMRIDPDPDFKFEEENQDENIPVFVGRPAAGDQ